MASRSYLLLALRLAKVCCATSICLVPSACCVTLPLGILLVGSGETMPQAWLHARDCVEGSRVPVLALFLEIQLWVLAEACERVLL